MLLLTDGQTKNILWPTKLYFSDSGTKFRADEAILSKLDRATKHYNVLEGARASTGLCVDVSMQWTNDINESN